MAICVIRRADGQVLVRADNPEQVTTIGDAYYFLPDIIKLKGLEQSGRIYQCPLKGTCYWIDLITEKGAVIDASWTYLDPKKDYLHITGWYGFYANHRYYETKECE